MSSLTQIIIASNDFPNLNVVTVFNHLNLIKVWRDGLILSSYLYWPLLAVFSSQKMKSEPLKLNCHGQEGKKLTNTSQIRKTEGDSIMVNEK